MLVSIIIPLYNVERYIERCILSCLNQSYTDIEIITVNDGSIDRSGIIAESFSSKHKTIKYISQLNQGVVKAREAGLKCSSGSYILFLDADDYLPSEAVSSLINLALNDHSDVVIGNFSKIQKDLVIDVINKNIYGNDPHCVLKSIVLIETIPSLWGKLFSRKLFKDIEQPYNVQIGEDFIVTLQLIYKATKVAYLNEIVYCYCYNEQSVTNKPSINAINSKLLFINWLNKFQKDFISLDSDLVMALNILKANELFGYLRDGGDFNSIYDITKIQFANYIDGISVSKYYPFWRFYLLRVYLISVKLGSLSVAGFNMLRKLKNNGFIFR